MKDETLQEASRVFETAAELFGVLSTPVRLRIIGALCGEEKNVSQLLDLIRVSQPNMSGHLNVLYRAGVVAKRRHGAQMFYRIADETAVLVCKAVCSQVSHAGNAGTGNSLTAGIERAIAVGAGSP
jgi:ArsR family transcriptional regulator